MARIDKDLIILIGRDRENPRTHRDAFQITGGLGKVLDEHIKRNNLNKSEFIREAIAAKLEAEMQKEPRINNEDARNAVYLWASSLQIHEVRCKKTERFSIEVITFEAFKLSSATSIEFASWGIDADVTDGKIYTIAELCGEEEE